MPSIRIKRAYDAAAADDGYRILVDRLWPRGVSKERAAVDEWLKDIAPSPDLRTWWDHDSARMTEFTHRYEAELEANPTAVQHLLEVAHAQGTVTLIYAAHDPAVNHAVVLQRFVQERLARTGS
ncbi:DUF488 domain-containing protein [Microbacterium sp. NPDC006705]|uniref:DUF488 domain-containing protein n=1 Tax=unclassified Microbacterium TaxID=2609290 RepID=UPI00249DF07A|nr:DUF488 family protein [Microbacterium sp. BDGP8]WHE36508.1 DUF488 family protein [Microbacterium sp. BDGP8]